MSRRGLWLVEKSCTSRQPGVCECFQGFDWQGPAAVGGGVAPGLCTQEQKIEPLESYAVNASHVSTLARTPPVLPADCAKNTPLQPMMLKK